MQNLPAGFKSMFRDIDGITLHLVHNIVAIDQRPAIVFLHGFPEFWIAWREVFTHLSKAYRILAFDQRGFNLSDAPSGAENYKTRLMVKDLFALADQLIGPESFVLAGHDWGGSVAYAAAISQPERISKLIIANGVHPVCFQNAMIDDPDQRAASQYFHVLTAQGAAQRMSESNFRRTFSMFEKFSETPWLNDDIRLEYINAWSQPGRLQSMLHWYASSPIVVPKPGSTNFTAPLYQADPAKFKIKMPHLLIWGKADQALRPSAIKDLPKFADRLQTETIETADHWLLHSYGEQIAKRIDRFIKQ